MKTDKCRSCGRPIIWCFMVKSGKRMPVDAKPAEDGNVAIDQIGDGPVTAVVAGPCSPLFPEPRYTSHFATCPEAARWRRG